MLGVWNRHYSLKWYFIANKIVLPGMFICRTHNKYCVVIKRSGNDTPLPQWRKVGYKMRIAWLLLQGINCLQVNQCTVTISLVCQATVHHFLQLRQWIVSPTHHIFVKSCCTLCYKLIYYCSTGWQILQRALQRADQWCILWRCDSCCAICFGMVELQEDIISHVICSMIWNSTHPHFIFAHYCLTFLICLLLH